MDPNNRDPMQALLRFLQENFARYLPADALAIIESAATELFAKFEWVPKHDFELQVQMLATLEQQVAALEQRVAELEGRP